MLQIKGLQYRFGEKIIFGKLNLDFSPEKIHGIVGANGIGKTTFFRVLSKIYKNQGGEVLLNGNALNHGELSFLPTEPFFYSHMNGREYLEIVLAEKAKIERAKKMAGLLELPLKQLVESYSTGMKKKLAFIACVAQQRPVEIFDEPFNGVDLESNEIIKYWIKKQNPESIKIISSHILSSLTDICDDIFYIEPGFVVNYFAKEDFSILEEKIKRSIKKRMDF